MLSIFSKSVPLVLVFPEDQTASAKDLNTSIQATDLEAIKSVDSVNVENAFERKGLLLESNLFAEKINEVVFQLQNVVVDLEDSNKVKQDLVQFIGKLVQSSYAVFIEINKNVQNLKTQLKEGLHQVATVSADLVEIIGKNKLPEYSPRLLHVLVDLLHAIELVKICNQVLNESADNIKEFLKEDIKRISNEISGISIQNGKLGLFRIIKAINNHCKHVEGIVGVFLKQHGDQYPEDIRNLMVETCKELKNAEGALEKLYSGTDDVGNLINLVTNNMTKRCETIAKLVCSLEIGKVVDSSNKIPAGTDDLPANIWSRRMKTK